MRRIILGLLATLALAAPVALASSADAATTGNGTYTSFAQSDQTYNHAGTFTATCNADGSIALSLVGDETAGVGDGHSLTATINGGVLAVTALRTGDNYGYSYAGVIDASGAWTMTAYNDEALQQGVTGGGQFTGLPDCVVDPPAPVGNHGQCVSGATKSGIKGKDLAVIAKDETKVGAFGSATCKV